MLSASESSGIFLVGAWVSGVYPRGRVVKGTMTTFHDVIIQEMFTSGIPKLLKSSRRRGRWSLDTCSLHRALICQHNGDFAVESTCLRHCAGFARPSGMHKVLQTRSEARLLVETPF